MSDDGRRSAREKLRAEVEAAMEDPSQWADDPLPVRSRRSEKRQRAAMISIRLSVEELEAVQTEAAARGLTVSRYVRDRALEHAVPRLAAPSAFGFVLTNRTSKDLWDAPVEVVEQAATPAAPYVLAPGLELVGASSSERSDPAPCTE